MLLGWGGPGVRCVPLCLGWCLAILGCFSFWVVVNDALDCCALDLVVLIGCCLRWVVLGRFGFDVYGYSSCGCACFDLVLS